MMFNLYDLIKAGHSADDLAKEFTESLNSAEARIQEEEAAKRAEEEARAAEEAERVQEEAMKRHDFEDALYQLWTTIGRYYPELAEEDKREESVAVVTDLMIRMLDNAMKPKARSFNPFSWVFEF